MSQNDRLYKLFFSFSRMVEDLLRGFVHEDWVEQLDFTTLEKANASYVSRELQERTDDAVWRLKGRNQVVYIYILLEFQSTDDRFMAARLLTYVGLLYQDLIRRGELTASGKLPPVLPIVPYNGHRPWTACLEMADLVEQVTASLTRYCPNLRYLLIDEKRTRTQHLAATGNLVAALFQLQRSQGPEEVQTLVSRLVEWLAEPQHYELRRTFALWLSASLLPLRMPGVDIPEVNDLQEFKTMIDEQIVPWTEQWKQQGFLQGLEQGMERGLTQGLERGLTQGLERGLTQGLERGRQLGEAQLLLRQLAQKFGSVSPRVRTRIETADAEQLLLWGERVLSAATLDEVFE